VTEYDDEVYEDDEPCPKCGNATKSRDCTSLGCDEGAVSLEDDDPVNYGPSDFGVCETCRGYGVEWWCPKCGYDMNLTREMTNAKS
jgi:predicted RNA-binding Zn-ribbon protein involved in translation (DUF1610 family)